MKFILTKNSSRPSDYFTVKQKSLLQQTPQVIKMRPIISHFLHPCRSILRRVARALTILVSLATKVVRDTRDTHIPIWRMHQGTHQWLEAISESSGNSQLAEFDVEDCFLNTPREMVVPALQFWMDYPFSRKRAKFFAISKDSKSEDHLGRPCSSHFWELSAEFVIAAVEWEVGYNSLFEVIGEDGQRAVLRQHKGLPIGGHFSAALVELVALFREVSQPWPVALKSVSTARYRDNFFAVFNAGSNYSMPEIADCLTELLCMPVKPVGSSTSARFLETRLSFATGQKPKCLLAFRTDADRQGESGDVDSWPLAFDPRAKMLIPGLIMGLVSKLRFYTTPKVGGFTATVRCIYQFMKARRYPTRWWLRPLAVALVRVGVAVPCMPPLLRKALSWPAQRHGKTKKHLKRVEASNN